MRRLGQPVNRRGLSTDKIRVLVDRSPGDVWWFRRLSPAQDQLHPKVSPAEYIERTPVPRVGFTAVSYHGCLYRVIRGSGKPARIRPAEGYVVCHASGDREGERIDRPTGRAQRDMCARLKVNYKVAKRTGNRAETAWWLSRARWARCSWRTRR